MGSNSIYDQLPYDPTIHPRDPRQYDGPKVTDFQTFQLKAQWVHGFDRFEYLEESYINTNSKITITCKIHGRFEQNVSNHLMGRGCKKCSGKHKMTNDEFIEAAESAHKGKGYDFSLVSYKNNKQNVTVVCPRHGEFNKEARTLIKGSGCPNCAKVSCYEDFVHEAEKAHGRKYSYDKFVYINARKKGIITCLEHGDFEQTPNNHLAGKGCPDCGGRRKKTQEEFLSEAVEVHGHGTYFYDMVEYVNIDSMVIIGCPIHGYFDQVAYSHLKGKGCSKCARWKATESEISRMSDEEKNLPYYLYHVRFSTNIDEFDKIGVTKFKDILKRFSSSEYSEYSIEVIEVEEGTKESILLKEIQLLKEMEDCSARYKVSRIRNKFSGWSECFNVGEFDPVLE